MSQPLTKKQQYWSDQLQRVEASGLSLSDYARENDIALKHLYQWRSTLKKLNHVDQSNDSHHFAQVVSTVSPTLPLTLQLGHAQLQFGSLPEPSWILTLIEQAHKP